MGPEAGRQPLTCVLGDQTKAARVQERLKLAADEFHNRAEAKQRSSANSNIKLSHVPEKTPVHFLTAQSKVNYAALIQKISLFYRCNYVVQPPLKSLLLHINKAWKTEQNQSYI